MYIYIYTVYIYIYIYIYIFMHTVGAVMFCFQWSTKNTFDPWQSLGTGDAGTFFGPSRRDIVSWETDGP